MPHYFYWHLRLIRLFWGPLSHFSALSDLSETKKVLKKFSIFFQFFPQAGTVEENTWHIEVLLLFLSLRYGLDLAVPVLFMNIFGLKQAFCEVKNSFIFGTTSLFPDKNIIFEKGFVFVIDEKKCFRVLCVSFWVFLGQYLRSFFVKGDLCGTDESFFNDRGKGLFFLVQRNLSEVSLFLQRELLARYKAGEQFHGQTTSTVALARRFCVI